MLLRSLWLVPALACLQPLPAWAVDPSRRISQYAHTTWRTQDGAFGGAPLAIAQTADAYVWFGTSAGLMRFDGINFVGWSPGTGQRLPSTDVQRLLAARDGSLWIGTSSGLSRWKDGVLTNYATGPGGVIAIAEGRDGTIWFPGNRAGTGSGPLCRVVDATTRCTGNAPDIPPFRADAVVEDRAGNLWVGGDTALLRWTSESHSVYPLLGSHDNAGMAGVVALASASDETLWVGFGAAGRGLGLQRLVRGGWLPFEAPGLRGETLGVAVLHVDRQGALWIGGYDRGLYRIVGNRVDAFDRASGLSGDQIMEVLEDREGNLWVVTSRGLDHFSDTPVITFSDAEGACSREISTVASGGDGSLWAGGDGALTRWKDGRITCVRSGQDLPGRQVTSVLEDRGGRLWVGLDQGLWADDRGGFRQVRRRDGRSTGMVTGIAEDGEGSVWIAASGESRILMRIEDGTVSEEPADVRPPRRVAVDPTGGLWLGLLNGDLAHYRDGAVEVHRFAHGESALLQQLLPDADGSVLAATSYGLIGWHNGRQLTLNTETGLPCDGVYALTFDRHGDLWLYMNCALGVLTRADLRAWKENPDTRVSIRTLGALDGVRTGWAAFAAAARSVDGCLWFANGSVVQTFDPERRGGNALAPPVHIEQVVADRVTYPAADVVRLPPLTRDLEIDYVGLSFVAPQKVAFRYRLDGRDAEWQEPGTRRQAFYTDLRPGTYRFRVIASNNDGVWNEEGASLDIVVASAWYQTSWFLPLSVIAGGAGTWAVYRLRLQQIANTLHARFEERLAERTRVARDLHDTLLQTVQGSKMVADNALDRPHDADGLRRAMEQLSSWMGQASREARVAVNALRGSGGAPDDLADAFRRAVAECAQRGAIEATVSVTGDASELHPVARDEVYRIAFEAIRNACGNSGGRRLEVALDYAQDLTVRVSDDGAGIDPAMVDARKPGHVGLQGMRERAARIGATLSVVGRPGSGTDVVVTVPRRVIFHRPTATVWQRLSGLFRSTAVGK
jgi:signal transduction histidine kinase